MAPDKRQKIIQAAITIFAREGLEKGKIAEIAREAGIGKGTVYEYFRSKEEIFYAIETSVMDELTQSVTDIMTSDMSPREKLISIINTSINQIVTMEDALLIIMELWAQAARGYWHEHKTTQMAEIYAQYQIMIQKILQDGIDAGQFREMNKDGVATLLMAFIDGLVWQYVLLRDSNRFTMIKSEAIHSFMKGIEK